MNPPFDIEQFFGVFVVYNAIIWPAQTVAYVLGVIAVAAVWSRRPAASCVITSVLALMWAIYLIFRIRIKRGNLSAQ